MGKRFERYKANHDFGPTFVGTSDGVGGLVVPNEAMAQIIDGTVVFVDEIPYPFVIYKGKDYPVVKTPQGWTIGGEHAEKQHAKNVANNVSRRRLHRLDRAKTGKYNPTAGQTR